MTVIRERFGQRAIGELVEIIDVDEEARQIIVAAEIATDGLDFAQLDPMVSAAERELEAAGVKERPEVVLADAGYWSNSHIDRLRARGITPIVAPDAHSREGPRKTRLGGP